jgi:hypothetical protein
MAPHSQAATAGKRKKTHKPGKALAVKSTDPVPKKAHKQKKQRPDAAAADEPAGGGGVLLSAALPPARQLEFLLRSFERAAKMRLSPLELGAYSGTRATAPGPVQFDSARLRARLALCHSVRRTVKDF